MSGDCSEETVGQLPMETDGHLSMDTDGQLLMESGGHLIVDSGGQLPMENGWTASIAHCGKAKREGQNLDSGGQLLMERRWTSDCRLRWTATNGEWVDSFHCTLWEGKERGAKFSIIWIYMTLHY